MKILAHLAYGLALVLCYYIFIPFIFTGTDVDNFFRQDIKQWKHKLYKMMINSTMKNLIIYRNFRRYPWLQLSRNISYVEKMRYLQVICLLFLDY